jgi:hypothetical protein
MQEDAKPLNVLLFDVDGVLVEPNAYKAAILATLEILCKQVGLRNWQDVLPSDDDIAHLESCGIHDVWDMTNIMFSAILERITFHLTGTEAHEKNLSDRLEGLDNIAERLAVFQKTPLVIQRPDYIEVGNELLKRHPMHPPDALLQIVEGRIRKQFAATSLMYSLLEIHKAFLLGTRSAYESYGTGLFQNVLLGKETFEKTYKLIGEYNGEALLRTADKPLISPQSVQTVHELNKWRDCKVGIYTARPSSPPHLDAGDEDVGFSPEAEMAAELCGLQDIPLVGMGMMEWLAKRHNTRTEDLTKPNTTHALSAVAAAIYQQSGAEVLEAAYSVDKMGENARDILFGELAERPIKVYVFEDTISGINPMLALAKKLQGHGITMSVQPMGIAQQKSKHQALQMVCQHVFGNVDFGLRFALHELQKSLE